MLNIPYSDQAKTIAIIEMLTSVACFLFILVPTVAFGMHPELRTFFEEKDPNGFLAILFQFSLPEQITTLVIPNIYFIAEFMLAVLLYFSVAYRNYRQIRLWYIVTITICMTGLYFFLPGVFFTEESYYFYGLFFVSYAFTAYSLWVVHCLLLELKSEGLHAPIHNYEEYLEKL